MNMKQEAIDSIKHATPGGRKAGSRTHRQGIYAGMTAGAVITVLGLLIVPVANAQSRYAGYGSGALRVRVGLFEPDGESEYWDAQFQDFTGNIENLKDVVAGAEYLWPIGRSTSLAFGIGAWEGDTVQGYRDFTDQDGNAIRHTTSLEATDLTVAFVHRFGSSSARVAPYIGVGAGFLWWRLEENGDFIDFGSQDLPVVYAVYSAEGTTTEVFALAGLEIGLTSSWAFLVETRWRKADDELGDDYEGFGKIDLGGKELTAGFSFRF